MFTLPTLSVGLVPMSVGPVPDRARLEAFVAVLRGIRGVDRVVVDRFDGVESLLTVHLDRPTPLAGELRAALHPRIVSCRAQDGRLAVVLASADVPLAPQPVPRMPEAGDRWVRAAAAPAGVPLVSDPAPRFGDLVERDAAARVIDELPDVSVLTFDRELRFTSRAGALYSALGRPFAAIRGRAASEVVRPATWTLVRRGYEGAVAGRTSVIDFPGLGDETVHESTFSPLMDGTTLIGGTVVTRDVTEARRGARLFHELEDVLRVMFDHAPIGYALVTPEGRWVRANAVLQEMLGIPETRLVTGRMQDVTHPEDVALEASLLGELAAGTRDQVVVTKRFRHADGGDVPVLVTATMLRSADEQPHGLVLQVTPQVV